MVAAQRIRSERGGVGVGADVGGIGCADVWSCWVFGANADVECAICVDAADWCQEKGWLGIWPG